MTKYYADTGLHTFCFTASSDVEAVAEYPDASIWREDGNPNRTRT